MVNILKGKKICLINASLAEPGSGNFIMMLMANHWAAMGCDVSVMTFNDDIVPVYELAPGISFHPLNLFYPSASAFGTVKNFISRLGVIRKAIKSTAPDVVLCMLEDPILRTLLATRGLGIPVVCVSHTDVLQHPTSFGRRLLQNLVFPMADRFVVLTEKIRKSLPWPIRRRALVIPNPILPTKQSGQVPDVPKPYVISVGRLLKPKRHEMLINIFANVAAEFPEWKLVILGEGPEQERLESLRDSLGLGEKVFLPGFTDYVGDWLAHSEIFAFPSLYEGFPLAVCEALLEELPVVVSDFPSGPECVVANGESGFIVPLHSEDEFATALVKLMKSATLRERFGKRGKEITSNYRLGQVLSYWDALMTDVLDHD